MLGRLATRRALRLSALPGTSRTISTTPAAMLPHLPHSTRRDESASAPTTAPFLLPTAGLHTTPPAEHGYVNPKFPKRPISPHVTIYAFPTVAWSSITMRVSGVFLSIGCAGVGGLACMDPAAPVELMSTLGSSPMLAIPAKVAVSFPLVYHFAGALRHTVRVPSADTSPVR